jgi:thymidylate synthase
MKEGFPLLTTKKMPFRLIVTELLWFLRGDTNIKYLVDNNCHIWDGDAYKNYKSKINLQNNWEITLRVGGVDTIGQQELLSQEEFINKIKTDDEFANKWGELGPVYGKQWRAFGGYEKVPSGWEHHAVTHYKDVPKGDQILNLINDLKTNPDSRRLMVNAWNVNELDQMVLPPCHYSFQVYTRELTYEERRKLFEEKTNRDSTYILSVRETLDKFQIPTRAISLMWNQRSVDTFLGLPFNIASYGLLLEILAKEVNMVPDQLIGNLGDTHLYLNHIEQAKEQIGREFTFDERLNLLKKLDLVKEKRFIKAKNETIYNLANYYNIPTRTREPYPLPKLVICGDMNRTDGFTVPFDELEYQLIKLIDYQSHPTIKAPLSN